ncbi:MAG: zinc-dependent alcohol dehydrogenase family protein [Erysipelotrichales bacterium]|nr:zinc-dependent alcohol dehydrogenase family protein [Erysipelotrichales bacterium]
MKALVLKGYHDLAVEDFPEPAFTEDSVKIAVYYGGLCGTDLHKYDGKGGSHGIHYPVPLGHEIAGIVEKVGANVKNFKPGDRVTADPNWNCGKCYFCRNGMPHMCENAKGVVKGFAEYICPPESNVYHLPDNLSLKAASMTEPLSCCVHGIDQLDVQVGQTVLLVGMGAIGTMMLQLLRLTGANQIIVVETVEEKRELAFSLGATMFINPLKENVKEVIKAAGIPNVDRVIECVGAKVTIENALDYAGKCATVVLFGLGNPENPSAFNQYAAFQKELTIKNSFVNPGAMQRSVDLLASGKIDVNAFVSKVMTLEELKSEIEHPVYSRKGKVIAQIRDEKGNVL